MDVGKIEEALGTEPVSPSELTDSGALGEALGEGEDVVEVVGPTVEEVGRTEEVEACDTEPVSPNELTDCWALGEGEDVVKVDEPTVEEVGTTEELEACDTGPGMMVS